MIPFIVHVKREGETKAYVLRKEEVRLLNDSSTFRYHFEEVRNELSLPTVTVREEAIYRLSVDTLVTIAKAAVQDAGLEYTEAATLVSGLAGEASRLSHAKRDELNVIIQHALEANWQSV